MNHQDLQTKINAYTIVAGTSDISVEENLQRHVLLGLDETYEVIRVNSSRSLTPMSEKFNIGNEIISDEMTTYITIVCDEEIKGNFPSLFFQFDGDPTWYKLVEQNMSMKPSETEFADTETDITHVYKLMDVSLEDRKHNFSQVFHIIENDEDLLRRHTSAKISKVTTPQMLINKMYGIGHANNKLPLKVPNLMPTVVTPLSTHHDSKFLHLARDLSKAIDLKYVDDMMQAKTIDECLVFGKRASDVPIGDQPTDSDYQLALSLRKLYINCILMTHGAATGFADYQDNSKIAGIEVKKITKLSPDICVKMVIDRYIHANPSITDSESWRRFLTMLFASSRFIAGGAYTTESGQDSTATTLLPFYVSPTTQINTSITNTTFKVEVKSKLFKITDRTTNTYISDPKILENLYKERVLWAGSWFQYDVLKNNLSVDTSIINIEKRIFSEDSTIPKNLVFGQFSDVNKYKQYCGQDSSKPSVQKKVTKTFTYSFSGITPIRRTDLPTVAIVGTYYQANPNVLLDKNKYPKANAEIFNFMKQTSLPAIWKMVSYKIYLENAIEVGRHGEVSMNFRIVIEAERTMSVTEISENYNNPVLDHEDTQELLNLISNSSKMEITPVGSEYIQYIFIRAMYFDTYELEVELEYEDFTDPNNPVKKTETKSLGIHNFKSKNDNSVTVQKIAISQTRVI